MDQDIKNEFKRINDKLNVLSYFTPQNSTHLERIFLKIDEDFSTQTFSYNVDVGTDKNEKDN